MHYMTESAATGVRERRMIETRRALTDTARRLTAQRGFSGFTVEELCEAVGVSRRTFFNYFRSKDDAVVGYGADEVDDEAVAEFLARGPSGGRNLVPELLEFSLAHMRRIGLTPQAAADFIAAIEREPELMHRMMREGGERERQLAELVAEREGFAADHPAGRVAISITMAIIRTSGERFVSPGNTAAFDDLVEESLTAARGVIAPDPAISQRQESL